MNFLERIVDDLVKRGIQLRDCAAVFPSRRAGVHFREALRRHPGVQKPLFSPAVYSIEEFISELSGTAAADPLALVFRLYGDYCQVASAAACSPSPATAGEEGAQHQVRVKSFAEFYQWGRTILTDFDEIDQYLIDTNQLFANLRAISQLENYAADTTEAERVRDRIQRDDTHRAYLDFAGLLQPLYARFTAGIDRDGLAYYGRALRRTAGLIAAEPQLLQRWSHIVFAGFNALTTGEEQVINAALKTGNAGIYWDMDRYFADDPAHEAGVFFRNSGIVYPSSPASPSPAGAGEEGAKRQVRGESINWLEERIATDPKQVKVTGAAGNVTQAKLCGSILAEHLQAGAVPETCAVVLADENLLMPVLHALPDGVSSVNVTMGFPLRHTPVYTFIAALIELHENRRRLELDNTCYYRDAENILLHPYLRSLTWPVGYELVNTIRKENLIHVPQALFADCGNALISDIFTRTPQSADDFLAYLLHLFHAMKAGMQQNDSNTPFSPPGGEGRDEGAVPASKKRSTPIDFEYLYAAWTLLIRLRDILAAAPVQLDPASFRRVLREILASASIPFTGEPLEGVQIMGVLETRAIDFDRVIILSLNEGVFPAGKGENSLIPYDVRKAVGLPTYEQRDAIYAYHFYRLFTRAGRIDLLYNTETTSEIGKAGRSRFIEQVLCELPARNPNAVVTDTVRALQPEFRQRAPLAIPKTPELLEKLAQREFSASALNTYIQCPLKFYFRYGLDLREPNAVIESAEQSTFGIVVHQVLQDIYHPFIGKPTTKEALLAVIPRLPKAIAAAYGEVLKHSELTGKNLLLANVAEYLLDKFLRAEADDPGHILHGTELSVESVPFTFTIDGKPRTVKLHGTIDRIDERDNHIRIIDYKTGNIGSLSLALPDDPAAVPGTEETLALFANRSEVFQLLFYYQLVQSLPACAGKDTQLSLYAFRTGEFVSVRPSRGEPYTLTAAHQPVVAAFLTRVFTHLFDAGLSFTPCPDRKSCAFCPFITFC